MAVSSTPCTAADAPGGGPVSALAPCCPACGAQGLWAADHPEAMRGVCVQCGSCWETAEGVLTEVDSVACTGCRLRSVCESRPSRLADAMTSVYTLPDGGRVLVRPLLYSDREQLGLQYAQLSPESRRLRFFSAPNRLREADLEYLTKLDYRDHFAWAAFAVDDPGSPGIAVARYIRRQEPTKAEVAVTVLDDYQRRGVGTLLTRLLAEVAAGHGIDTLVTYVLWDNELAIDALVKAGARVTPYEPGVALLELDLSGPGADTETLIQRAVRAVARHALEAFSALDRLGG